MDLELNGLKALVTGSSSGIGREIASVLLQEHCVMAITGRNRDKLSITLAELRKQIGNENVLGFPCDFTNNSAVRELANNIEKTWGCLDILVCNVGSGKSVAPLDENIGEWIKMIDLNLLSAANALEHFLALLKKSTKASVVLISSICGIEALGAPVAYSVSKSSVISLAANLAAPLARYGVRVNVVSPGNILFTGSVWEEKKNNNPQVVEKMLEKEVPMRRFGSAREIADAVAFLASPKSSFTTGANLVIDGGQTRSI